MAIQGLLNNTVLDNTAVTGNGTFRLFESSKIPVQNNNALQVKATYNNALPNPETVATNYEILCLLESQDENGNWFPFHMQFEGHRKEEQGKNHELEFGPHIFTIDPGIVIDYAEGPNIVLRESRKQGILPDNFRVCVLVVENKYGEPGAFQSVEVTLTYEPFNV